MYVSLQNWAKPEYKKISALFNFLPVAALHGFSFPGKLVDASSSSSSFPIADPAMADEEAMEVNTATGLPFSRRYRKLLQQRKILPVWAYRSKFLDALAKHQVVIVAAPPGSGKSTQVIHSLS